jgi:hypothetical protein
MNRNRLRILILVLLFCLALLVPGLARAGSGEASNDPAHRPERLDSGPGLTICQGYEPETLFALSNSMLAMEHVLKPFTMAD